MSERIDYEDFKKYDAMFIQLAISLANDYSSIYFMDLATDNYVEYGTRDGGTELEILSDEKTVTMIFTDSGREFDPTKDVIDIEKYDRENSIGGLGRFLSFNIADDFSYEYKDGKNILTIVKNIGNEA